MICVFSKWLKEYLEKNGIESIDKIVTKDNVIYLYEDNELVRKTINKYICL